MEINIDKLRNGEECTCPICKKGKLVPINEINPDVADGFKCEECNEILNITKKLEFGM